MKEQGNWFQRNILRADILQVITGWLVGNVEHILIRATPVLSPLPSAFAITRALSGAQWWSPALVGGIIEAMGLCAGALIGYIATHNQRHPSRPIHPHLGYYLFGFYVVVVTTIVGGYEALPAFANWQAGVISFGDLIKAAVPLLFPGLTLIGAAIVALRDHMRRVDDEAERAQQKRDAIQQNQQRHQDDEHALEIEMKRKEAEQRLAIQQAEAQQRLELERMKVEAKLAAQPIASPVAAVAQPIATVAQRRETLLSMLRNIENPDDINKAALGRDLGVSRTQVDKDISALVDAKRLSINGVVKVLA